MIKNKITLKQLEALVYVADFGTFRRAADALGTTQPNISVRIAALEDALGVVLMHRDAGSIRLTDKGQAILLDAREVLRATEALLETAERRDLIEERLRLGVTELVAATWLRAFLRAIKVLYPSLRVELIVDLSVEIENALASDQLDLAILTEPFRTKTSGIVPLGRYRYGWVCTPEVAKELGPRPALAEVFRHGILSHGKHTVASTALRAELEKQGLRAQQITHSSSLGSALNMAVDGMGVALLPRQMFVSAIDEGQLAEIACAWEPQPLQFFSRFDAARAPIFVERIAALSAEIAAEDRA